MRKKYLLALVLSILLVLGAIIPLSAMTRESLTSNTNCCNHEKYTCTKSSVKVYFYSFEDALRYALNNIHINNLFTNLSEDVYFYSFEDALEYALNKTPIFSLYTTKFCEYEAIAPFSINCGCGGTATIHFLSSSCIRTRVTGGPGGDFYWCGSHINRNMRQCTNCGSSIIYTVGPGCGRIWPV